MSTPVSGSHNDLYNISEVLWGLFSGLKASGLSVSGLFLNADAGFDAEQFRRVYQGHGAFQTSPSISAEKRKGRKSSLTSYFTRRDIALKGPMRGWIRTEAY